MIESSIYWTAPCLACGGMIECHTDRASIKPDSAFRLKAGQVNVPATCLDCGEKMTVRVCQAPADLVLLPGWGDV